jgi:hypothetical protein
MANGIEALKVSLTKNGYFKVAEVIKKHPRNEILDNIHGVYEGINLETAQIKVMLSYVEESSEFPDVWDDIRSLGNDAVDALVFISIIYSHKLLITVLSESNISEMRGCLKRDSFSNSKVYTNLIYSMSTQKMCPLERGSSETYYDVSSLFRLDMGGLVKKILRLKLKATGWNEPAVDDYFSRNFYEQCEFYGFPKVLGISLEQFKQWLEGEKVQREEPPTILIPSDEISASASLISALAAKPFVILAGTTGTGKTKTIRDLALKINPVASESDFNHAFIPVEAGWTDGRHLVGYKNPFGRSGENYVSTKLIDLLLKANYPNYKDVPFFVILDEMNLSHVEMYFSKFLSVMETSNGENPEPIIGVDELQLIYKSGKTDPVQTEFVLNALREGGLYLSKNVFFVGTVNMDETTYMFSPKVLDRSFVIQYSPPKPSEVGKEFSISAEDKLVGKVDALSLFLTDSYKIDGSIDFDQYLDELYVALGKFKFGPRTTNEIRKYFSVCRDVEKKFTTSEEYVKQSSLIDRVTLQKVLPKINGNRDSLISVFKELDMIFEKEGLGMSRSKLEQMKKDVLTTGFANYFSTL